MGKRKIQILTPWQRKYIYGQISVDKKRRAVEDYYLRELLNKLDLVFEDLRTLGFWARKAGLEQSIVKSSEAEAVRKIFFDLKGKRPIRSYYTFDSEMQCPICNGKFTQSFIVRGDKVVLGKASFFGLSKKS